MVNSVAKHKKILIVEDDTALSQMLHDKFVDEGFEVQTQPDGQAGLQAALNWQPDMILLDIVMPRMDGMTMLHKLREHPQGQKLAVILLTNLSSTDYVYDAMANGVYDFLVKSHWDINELVHEVEVKLGPLQ